MFKNDPPKNLEELLHGIPSADTLASWLTWESGGIKELNGNTQTLSAGKNTARESRYVIAEKTDFDWLSDEDAKTRFEVLYERIKAAYRLLGLTDANMEDDLAVATRWFKALKRKPLKPTKKPAGKRPKAPKPAKPAAKKKTPKSKKVIVELKKEIEKCKAVTRRMDTLLDQGVIDLTDEGIIDLS